MQYKQHAHNDEYEIKFKKMRIFFVKVALRWIVTLSWREICKCNICLKRTAVGVTTQTALVMQIIKHKYVFGEDDCGGDQGSQQGAVAQHQADM